MCFPDSASHTMRLDTSQQAPPILFLCESLADLQHLKAAWRKALVSAGHNLSWRETRAGSQGGRDHQESLLAGWPSSLCSAGFFIGSDPSA
ncbi:hypothetical protein LEMLEM_LOCUS25495 [Lemmus lemmus]